MNSHWFQKQFRPFFPLAHLMRKACPQYWLRIHSLPGSKRYPGNEAERQTIFERYSSFGSALLGAQAPCLVIQSRLNGFQRDADLMPELEWVQIHQVEDSDGDVWDSWAAHTTWDAATFRALLLAVADWREAHIAFVSEVTDCVFIPYDGGADGFSLDAALLRGLREQFSLWLSAHPQGL